MNIRKGTLQDIQQIKNLGLVVWGQFKSELTAENWKSLQNRLLNEKIYADLIEQCDSFICENESNEIIGFSFLMPSGNPTDIFTEEQCYIRYLTVSEKYSGRKIGQQLTEKCIEKAIENGEKYIALHTSEMMPAARHIYEKSGFRISKEIEPRLGKKYWVYQLELTQNQNGVTKAEIKNKHTSPYYKWGNDCGSWVLVNEPGLSIKQETMPAGTKEQPHFHNTARQFFFLLKGIATFYIEDELLIVSEHSGLEISPGTIHFIANETNEQLDFLVISQPSTNNDRTDFTMRGGRKYSCGN